MINEEEIIKLAKEAGFNTTKHSTGWFIEYSGPCNKQLTAFSRLLLARLLLAHQATEIASPVDVDSELEAFEKWMVNKAKIIIGSSDPYPAGLERDYWRVWQARAALANPNNQDAEQNNKNKRSDYPANCQLSDFHCSYPECNCGR